MSYPLSALDEHSPHVTRYGNRRRYVVIWSTRLHQFQKPAVLHNAEGSHVLRNPSYDLGAIRGDMSTLRSGTLWYDTHRVSDLVSCLSEYVTVLLLMRSKAAVINPSVKSVEPEDLASTARAA